jgi:hypothetical protein
MRELAAAYPGPHHVVLNRNPTRRSIGGHINRIVDLARGELIVAAAGDDVSLPQRTAAVYEAWERSGRKSTSIHSDIIQIDERGNPMDRIFSSTCDAQTAEMAEQRAEPLAYVQSLEPIVFGCAHAFAPRLFREFGALPADVIHEDNALVFRSILAGQMTYIREALVKYRVHRDNVYIRSRQLGTDLRTLERQEDRVRRDFRNRETMYAGFELDLEKARLNGLIEAGEAAKIAQEVRRRRHRVSLMGTFLESGLLGKCRILFRLRREGLSQREFGVLARRLLPRSLLLRIRLARSCAAGSRSS